MVKRNKYSLHITVVPFSIFCLFGKLSSSLNRNFDDQGWGTFDNNDDVDSVWGFNNDTTKVSSVLISSNCI